MGDKYEYSGKWQVAAYEKTANTRNPPSLAGSFILMAEREGFEPPIALRLWLISSQLHSTGLCHLSSPEIYFTLL